MPKELLLALSPETWPTFVLISTRLGGLFLVAPVWSSTSIPRTVRAAMTVLLSLAMLPLVPRPALPDALLALPLLLALELVVGVVIGLSAAVLVSGVAYAGEVVSMQMGIHLGSALSPMPELEVPGIGELNGFLALFIYLAVGGHLVMLRGIADSLQILPPGTFFSMAGGVEEGSRLVGTLFLTALRTAVPVMLILLLSNVGLALLQRAVPNINAMMVAIPLTVLVGLLALTGAVPLVSASIASWMSALDRDVARAIQSLGSDLAR
jgi:flagellar biosynthetic protein FliR